MAQYCTLDELKSRLDITDNDDDTALDSVITSASAAISRYCGRKFEVPTEDTTRYFDPRSSWTLPVDDLVSVTTLKTDEDADGVYEITWATTDYWLQPANAATDDQPYTDIVVTPFGSYTFPRGTRAVEVVGRFGWPETPIEVYEACLLMAARLWKRSDTPFGLAGNAELGEIRILPRLDPDVRMLLEPLRDPRMMVG